MKKYFLFTLFNFIVLTSSCEYNQQDFDSGKAQVDAQDLITESNTEDSVEEEAESLRSESDRKNRESKKKVAQERIRELSNGYRTFPSSNDITNFLDKSLSSPGPSCAVITPTFDIMEGTISESAYGARRVLATMYQSCKAVDNVIDEKTPSLQGVSKKRATFDNGAKYYQREIASPTRMVNSHEILGVLKEDSGFPGSGCFDTTKRPPIYGYGSRKSLRRIPVNLFTRGAGVVNNGVPASGIDCSEFISTAFAVQGLKFKESDSTYNSLTTVTIHEAAKSSNSCIKAANFGSPETIRSGDIINYSGKHVIMIDTVSSDPLGVNKFANLNRCDEITVHDFDFTYTHSGALKNYGPARVHVKTHASKPNTMFKNLVVTARETCHSIVNNSANPKNIRGKFGILRHDSANESCRFNTKAPLKGEGCVEKCLLERTDNES